MKLLLERVRKAIGCPIDWESLLDNDQLVVELRIYWKEIAESFQADHEMDIYSALEFNIRGRSIDIRALEHNVAIWRSHAIQAYERRVGFFRDVTFKDERLKHHSFRNLSRSGIVARSSHVSHFFSDVDESRLEYLMWRVLAQRWHDIAEKRPRHIFLEAKTELGVSEGSTTKIMRFDLDYSNAQIHGHPRKHFDSDCEIPLLYENGFGSHQVYDDYTYQKYCETIDDDFEVEDDDELNGA